MLRQTTTIEAINQMAVFLASSSYFIDECNQALNNLAGRQQEAEKKQVDLQHVILLIQIATLTKIKPHCEEKLRELNSAIQPLSAEILTLNELHADHTQTTVTIENHQATSARLQAKVRELEASNERTLDHIQKLVDARNQFQELGSLTVGDFKNLDLALAYIKEELALVDGKLLKLYAQKYKLNAEFDSNSRPLKQLEEFENQVKQFDANRVVLLSSVYLYSSISELKRKLENCNKTIAELAVEIAQKQAELDSLVYTQTDYQNVLLISEPEMLVANLAAAMKDKFQLFEKTYPSNQSVYVRQCLRAVETKIDNVMASHDKGLIAYCQLYGMVLTFNDYVISHPVISDADFAFLKATKDLIELVKTMSIHASRPLFIDKEECLNLYIASEYNECYISFINKFYEQEAQDYKAAFIALSRTQNVLIQLEASPEITKHAEIVLAQTKETLAQNPADQQDQYKFLTTVLSTVDDVLAMHILDEQPVAAKQAQLTKLSTFMQLSSHSVPSTYHKLIGAVLMLAGALFALASVGISVLTLGATAPVAAGLGLLASTALIAGGFSIFHHKKREGVSLNKLHEMLNTPDQSTQVVTSTAYSI